MNLTVFNNIMFCLISLTIDYQLLLIVYSVRVFKRTISWSENLNKISKYIFKKGVDVTGVKSTWHLGIRLYSHDHQYSSHIARTTWIKLSVSSILEQNLESGQTPIELFDIDSAFKRTFCLTV